MPRILTISGSPSATSRTLQLNQHIGAQLSAQGFEVDAIDVRDLPAEALLHAQVDAPRISAALGQVEAAHGVIVATPVYKAAYTGVLKAFLDLLPQNGLAGKVVLPLAVGGTLAHLLAIDYALRPVLATLGAQHVLSGLFLVDKLVQRQPDGTLSIDEEVRGRLDALLVDFAASVRANHVRRSA